MSIQLIATAIALLAAVVLFRYLRSSPAPSPAKAAVPTVPATFPEPAPYIKALSAALPDSVILPKDVAAFGTAINVWFSTQNRDILPACVVKPRNVQELSTAVKHISREHALRASQPATGNGLFAVRAGAANPATGISGVKDGVVLDLALLNDIEPSEDRSYVTVGAGAYWRDVYKELRKHGLGVVGGRASPVGVGGSTLQGI